MKNNLLLNPEEKEKWMRSLIIKDNSALAKESFNYNTAYMNGDGGEYFLFSYLAGQILMLKNGESSFFNDYKNKGSFDKILQLSAPSMVQSFIFHGKNFKMTNAVWELLRNTKNKPFIRKHPFPIFSIDQKIKTNFEGLNIIFTIFIEVLDKEENPVGCNYISIGKDERDDSEFWFSGSIGMNKNQSENGVFTKEEYKEIRESVHQLYYNFLDYLNHPYSIQKIYKLSSNNEKRLKRGQFPRQDKHIIDIKKDFIETILVGRKANNKIKNKFWVRGHFKHFRNKERFKRIYSLSEEDREKENLFLNGNFISKWILPYIKGAGTMIEKNRRSS